MPTGIEDYGIIGDGRSAALVSRDGSVDWLCWPRFDSPSLFAAALDSTKGGRWRIAPAVPFRARRHYADGTNVLVTTFETSAGEMRLTDLMTVFPEAEKHRVLVPEHELLRTLECVRGEVPIEAVFEARPDYARRRVPLRVIRGLGARLEDGHELYTLRGDEDLDVVGDAVTSRFVLRGGERSCFSLTFDLEGPAVLPPLGAFALEGIERTERWWRDWLHGCTYDGPHRAAVVRSLLALKLLSFAPTGAIVAAPTTSFPERVGGDLNWDYRYCWLRDASLTVRAYLDLGYADEAAAFVSWLLHSTRLTRPELSILYDVYGGLPKKEESLDHLAGHRGSRPVRIGNAAATQVQLDTYGEVIDAVTQMCRHGASLDHETQRMLRQFGEYVCQNWSRPDQGIWEPREPPEHHTNSRVLCWTALDRLIELHDRGNLDRIPRGAFTEQRRLIRADVEQHGWSPRARSYTAVLGGETVDASVLLLAWYGFADAQSPRMRQTLARILERLRARPGLLYRYEQSRSAGEGAFGICAFWAVEILARGGGSLDDAERSFESSLSLANDLGLFAEEMDVETGAPLGNFPQAFTHVGVIGAALSLEARRKEATRGPRAEWTNRGAADAEACL
ncbi:MAG: glycoside hydrolase family 15 protein [Deltaproteobacteria bacterium]